MGAPLTIICYSVGVFGGLWEMWMGIPAGLLAAAINAGVVAYACTNQVKTAYGTSWTLPGPTDLARIHRLPPPHLVGNRLHDDSSIPDNKRIDPVFRPALRRFTAPQK